MEGWTPAKIWPPYEDTYLVTYTERYGKVNRSGLVGLCDWVEFKGEHFWNTYNLGYDIEVTAWMPLPAPYREEDDCK